MRKDLTWYDNCKLGRPKVKWGVEVTYISLNYVQDLLFKDDQIIYTNC
jgi:hypothetical protein